MARFAELTRAPNMLDYKAAAEQVITEAKKRQVDTANLLMSNGALKKQKGEGEDWVDRAIRELAFVGFLIKKGLAFECAEDLHLRAFLGVSRQQQLPRRARITNTMLPLLYNLVQEERNARLSRVQYFSITTDSWTSVSMDKYVAVTIHFVENDGGRWQLVSFLLDLIPLPARHTWINLTHAIAIRLANLLPPEATLAATITDNAYDEYS